MGEDLSCAGETNTKNHTRGNHERGPLWHSIVGASRLAAVMAILAVCVYRHEADEFIQWVWDMLRVNPIFKFESFEVRAWKNPAATTDVLYGTRAVFIESNALLRVTVPVLMLTGTSAS